jgi:DNA-binding SARP family transcriptional activator
VSRALVAGSLWPDKSEERAAANLRSAIWRLNTQVPHPLVESHGQALRLHREIDVDVRGMEACGWDLVRSERLPARLAIDQKLFLTPILPGWFDDWVIMERERLQQVALHFVDALITALTDVGRHAEALDAALRLVAVDPFREKSQMTLIDLYRSDGRIVQARHQYERYRSMLLCEFGCEPATCVRQLTLLPD